MIQKIKKLVGNNLMLAVKVVAPHQKEVKETPYGYVKFSEHKFPKIILIVGVQYYDGDSGAYITYFADKKTTTVKVPKDFEVQPLKVGKLLAKRYAKFQMTNMRGTLGKMMGPVGSDPEIFVEDSKGIVIPAFNFLGSKAKPDRTTLGTYGDKPLYWDGFQAEFETAAEACLAWQVDSVQHGLNALLRKAKAHNKDARLSLRTTMDIPHEMMEQAKEEHVAFGCMPSFNAYGLEGLKKDGREVPFRSAGGHIHFGIGQRTEEQAKPIVKALDAILGVACVSLFAKFDDPKRRQLYGLPGEFRLPPHGIEYRVLSNAWLCHPLIMNMVFDLARKVVVIAEKDMFKYWEHKEADTIKAIMKCDVKLARTILRKNKDLFMGIVGSIANVEDMKQAEKVYKIFLGGMESVILKPTDIAGNWTLEGEWVSHSDGINKNWVKAREAILSKKKVS